VLFLLFRSIIEKLIEYKEIILIILVRYPSSFLFSTYTLDEKLLMYYFSKPTRWEKKRLFLYWSSNRLIIRLFLYKWTVDRSCFFPNVLLLFPIVIDWLENDPIYKYILTDRIFYEEIFMALMFYHVVDNLSRILHRASR
jgi:hypothetical protein